MSDLFQIAFGYMASKALFTAARIGVFDVLESNSRSLADIQKTIGGEPEAIRTLMASLTTIGLVSKKDEMFNNSPIAQMALTKSGGLQFSKYLSMQADQHNSHRFQEYCPNHLTPSSFHDSVDDHFRHPNDCRR